MIFLLGLLVLQIIDFGGTELLEPRVYNGHTAKEGQFPYVVGIKLQNALNSFWCGGNIISPEWILTAAHCFDRWKPWQPGSGGFIYYGSTLREEGLRISFKYSDVVKHPNYTSLINDLALIKTTRIRFSKNIKAISLPSSMDRDVTYENEWALTAGWNRKHRSGSRPEKLLWTTVKIASVSECPEKYSTDEELPLCGRVKPGSSICDGDSGGPLVHQEKQTLIGVISFIRKGSTCDNGDLVGFANVANYLGWIRYFSEID